MANKSTRRPCSVLSMTTHDTFRQTRPLPGQPVQNMPAQRVLFRNVRVIELYCPGHAQPLHDSLRWSIDKGREGNDLVQSHAFETILDRRARRLGGVAVTPKVPVQPPRGLDRWGERCF